jgi:hypothetical protein
MGFDTVMFSPFRNGSFLPNGRLHKKFYTLRSERGLTQRHQTGCVRRWARGPVALADLSSRIAMFRFEPGLKVYLHREPVDGRKAINGLALLVEQSLGLDPFAPAVFVFSNRRRDRIKLLLWDRTGFWLVSALLRTSLKERLLIN